MKTNSAFRLLFLFVLVLLLTTASFSQTTPKKVYSEVMYHKLKPGHTFAEARAMENEFKKIHQFQANEGTLYGWYMLALETTTNPKKEYDYITINTFSDPGYIDNPYSNATMEKVMGSDYQSKTSDLYKRMQEIKEVAKIEIWENIEVAAANPMPSPDKFPLWLVTGMKVKNNRKAEYMARMKQLQPAAQEEANAGGIVGWNFSGLQFPWSTESPYEFASVFYFPNMKAVMNRNPEAAFKKVLPGVDLKQFYKELDAMREPGRQEIYYLVEYAVKASSEQAAKK